MKPISIKLSRISVLAALCLLAIPVCFSKKQMKQNAKQSKTEYVKTANVSGLRFFERMDSVIAVAKAETKCLYPNYNLNIRPFTNFFSFITQVYIQQLRKKMAHRKNVLKMLRRQIYSIFIEMNRSQIISKLSFHFHLKTAGLETY